MPRVGVIFTGGTISMRPDPAVGGNVPALDGAAILELAPGAAEIAELEPIDWGLVPASHLTFAQICDIARLGAATLARDDIDGLVIVQGTDTIEETAFAYDLLVATDKPIVVTGAMRDASAPDYDGPRNLADAVACASAASLRGCGVLVMLDGRAIAADQAVKTNTTAMDTFQPREGDVIAPVSDGVVGAVNPRSRRLLPRIPDEAVEDVHLITVVTGMSGALVRGIAESRPRGLVIAATGAGNTSFELLQATTALMARGTTVVLTTRCSTGDVDPAYAFPGGGVTWQKAGAILSRLDGPKSRVALALALSCGLGRDDIARVLQ